MNIHLTNVHYITPHIKLRHRTTSQNIVNELRHKTPSTIYVTKLRQQFTSQNSVNELRHKTPSTNYVTKLRQKKKLRHKTPSTNYISKLCHNTQIPLQLHFALTLIYINVVPDVHLRVTQIITITRETNIDVVPDIHLPN